MRTLLAILVGILVGGFVNMGLITVSGSIIPYPEGYDMSDMDGMKATIHLLEPRHFLFPFVAHAMGTLMGGLVAGGIAGKLQSRLAMGIGVFFLIGGITMAYMVPAPTWFIVTDLVLAYIPMACLAGKLMSRKAAA